MARRKAVVVEETAPVTEEAPVIEVKTEDQPETLDAELEDTVEIDTADKSTGEGDQGSDAPAPAAITAEQLEGAPFLYKLPRGFGQCEFIEDEPGRRGNRVPARPANSPFYFKKQCTLAARFGFKALVFTGSRSGTYCLGHVIEEIDRSSVERERLDNWLARDAG